MEFRGTFGSGNPGPIIENINERACSLIRSKSLVRTVSGFGKGQSICLKACWRIIPEPWSSFARVIEYDSAAPQSSGGIVPW